MIKWFNHPVPQFDDCVITMGNFDGIHLGHQKVIGELNEKALQIGVPAVVLTYWEHPGHFVHFKHQVPILTPRMMKKPLLNDYCVNQVFFLNFNADTTHTGAKEFLNDVIIRHFHPSVIVAGHDSHFGYQREGNADFLKSQESEFGYQTLQIEPVYCGKDLISSSLIRSSLQNGKLSLANAMLGRPYRLYGSVIHGTKMGRTIGFPTINLSLADNEQQIPANGVYLSRIFLNGKSCFGLTNIGTSPTLKKTGQIEIETFVLGYDSDVYDIDVQLDLLEYIREEKTFSSLEELKFAIAEDVKQGIKLIGRL